MHMKCTWNAHMKCILWIESLRKWTVASGQFPYAWNGSHCPCIPWKRRVRTTLPNRSTRAYLHKLLGRKFSLAFSLLPVNRAAPHMRCTVNVLENCFKSNLLGLFRDAHPCTQSNWSRWSHTHSYNRPGGNRVRRMSRVSNKQKEKWIWMLLD